MRIVEANVVELAEADVLKKIELCGRICYKSEDKITDTSCFAFVSNLIKHQHLAMTEHAVICLSVTEKMAKAVKRLGHGTFINVTLNGKQNRYLISGNVRAWINLFDESRWTDAEWLDIKRIQTYMYMSMSEKEYNILFPAPKTIPSNSAVHAILTQKQIRNLPNLTSYEAKTHLYATAVFTCDRGVTHEIVRHRTASFAQESTRYCNYVKGKFGGEITVIRPLGLDIAQEAAWRSAIETAENCYKFLIDSGCTPQIARDVLPTCTKAELVVTANLEEWQHILNLRYHGTTGAPHPKAKEVMAMWHDYLVQNDNYNKWIV